jgi:heat-inducible transcriptional repressor
LLQPEFRDIDRVKEMMDLFSESSTLVKLFAPTSESVKVNIGVENNMQLINHCTLIRATYSLGDKPIGSIGIIGPTRMDYAKVITLVNYLSKHIEMSYHQWYSQK